MIVPGKDGENHAMFHCGVYVNWRLGVKALSATTVKVAKLPAGLKFTAKDIVDSKTKEVTVHANSIYGVPTKHGEYNVQITVTTAGKKTVEYDVLMIARTLDAWAVGQFDGGLAVSETVGGTASLTVAEGNGKISGKFVCQDGKTWTISAPYFTKYEYDDEKEMGKFYATLTFKCGKEEVTQDMIIVDPGEFTIGEPNVAILGDLCAGELLQTFWKFQVWKDFGKVINKKQLRLTDVDGTLDLTFSSNGSVKIALAHYNGYKATCSTTLIPVEMPDSNGSFHALVYFCFPENRSKGWSGVCSELYLKWDGSKGAFEEIEDD